MSPNCLRKWEEENTRRRREHTLPPPNQYVAWTLNWLNDFIQTNKRSTIKMELGNKENSDKDAKKSTTSNSYAAAAKKANGSGQVKTLNNFFTLADAKKQWNKDKDPVCIICEGKHHVFKCKMEGVTTKVARDRVMKAGACINCLKTDHYVNKCKAGGCRVKGCGKRHNTRLHDPEAHGPFKKSKTQQAQKTQSKE